MSEETQFEPMGGYPPIIKKSDLKPTKTTSSTRGFSSANILKIQDILKKGKNIPVLYTIVFIIKQIRYCNNLIDLELSEN